MILPDCRVIFPIYGDRKRNHLCNIDICKENKSELNRHQATALREEVETFTKLIYSFLQIIVIATEHVLL